MAATKALANQVKFLFNAFFTSNPRARNDTNSIPCIQPHTLTASGIPAAYLSGIAIPNNTKKEMPSAMATILNH